MSNLEKNVILVRGVMGSGKSTFAKMLIAGRDAVLLENDMYMYDENGVYHYDETKKEYYAKSLYRDFMQSINAGVPYIVICNASPTWKNLKHYRKLAIDNGYKFTSLVIENRNETISVHDVDEEKVERFRKEFVIKL